MWNHLYYPDTRTTPMPVRHTGKVSVESSAPIRAYVNGRSVPVDNIVVAEGDHLAWEFASPGEITCCLDDVYTILCHGDTKPQPVPAELASVRKGETTMDLAEHEANSVERYKHLKKHIKKHTRIRSEEMSAREDVNLVGMPGMGFGGGHDGFGLGGGLMGGLLLGALLRNGGGGLFGGNGEGGGLAGINNLQGAIDTNAIMSNLSDIKAAVPLSEAQVQLALAGVQSDITSQTLQQTIALQQQNFAGQLQASQGFSATQALVMSGNASVIDAVQNDGEKTRALIGQIDRENLNRIITTQASELAELRNESSRSNDRHGIEITMMNNQNQNQLQFQQQNNVLGQLAGALVEVGQVARATNQNLIVGNTGATTTGAQTSTPTNVRV